MEQICAGLVPVSSTTPPPALLSPFSRLGCLLLSLAVNIVKSVLPASIVSVETVVPGGKPLERFLGLPSQLSTKFDFVLMPLVLLISSSREDYIRSPTYLNHLVKQHACINVE